MASEDETPPPTSAVLMSISKHLAARCSKQSKAFIECKRKDKNPEACLKEGDAVTACAIET
jgi:NADH dehydrogenase (ubiquinone) 1 alpha subcomplex subunit 8